MRSTRCKQRVLSATSMMWMALALIWTTPALADTSAGDASGGTPSTESTPDPSEGMRVSAPMKGLAEAWQKIDAGRPVAINRLLEGLRSTKRGTDLSSGPNFGATDGLYVMTRHRLRDLTAIRNELTLADDKMLARLLGDAFADENRRLGSIVGTKKPYGDLRDAVLDQTQNLQRTLKTTASTHRNMSAYLQEIERVTSLSAFPGLEQAVRKTLQQKSGFDPVIQSVDQALRQAERCRARATLLAHNAREEKREFQKFIRNNSPDLWGKQVRALPPMVPSESSSGLASFSDYARLNQAAKEVLDKHLDALAEPYGDLQKGVGRDMMRLCDDVPGIVRRYERRLEQLKKWKQQLIDAKEEARKWKERQESGVTGRG